MRKTYSWCELRFVGISHEGMMGRSEDVLARADIKLGEEDAGLKHAAFHNECAVIIKYGPEYHRAKDKFEKLRKHLGGKSWVDLSDQERDAWVKFSEE